MTPVLEQFRIHSKSLFKSLEIDSKDMLLEVVICGLYQDRERDIFDPSHWDGIIPTVVDFNHSRITSGAYFQDISERFNYQTVDNVIIKRALVGLLAIPDTAQLVMLGPNGNRVGVGNFRQMVLEGKISGFSLDGTYDKKNKTLHLITVSALDIPPGSEHSKYKIIQKSMTKNDNITKCLCDAYLTDDQYYTDLELGGVFEKLTATETEATIKNVITLEEITITSEEPKWNTYVQIDNDDADEFKETYQKACQTCANKAKGVIQEKVLEILEGPTDAAPDIITEAVDLDVKADKRLKELEIEIRALKTALVEAESKIDNNQKLTLELTTLMQTQIDAFIAQADNASKKMDDEVQTLVKAYKRADTLTTIEKPTNEPYKPNFR